MGGFLLLIIAAGFSACGQRTVPTGEPLLPSATSLVPEASPTIALTETPAPTLPPPPSVLTICMGREPASLFLYEANSQSAQSVLAAVYDGPFDTLNGTTRAVILEKVPAMADGDVVLEAVEVKAGDLIADANGTPVQLAEGVSYRPAGCTQSACSAIYSGSNPVQMDQLGVRFSILAGLQWSDGAPLTADDSLYSYEVAQALYPAVLPELLARTANYQALDERSVEWTGLPGFMDGRLSDKFFSPLPRHAWGSFPPNELPALEAAARLPIGWGAYLIEEWTAGDHITLNKNPLYFRAGEGLPLFDHLVYRFMADGNEALAALQTGECDLIDQTAGLESEGTRLAELQDAGQIQAVFQTGAAWELIQFGVSSLDAERPAYFASQEVRQAVAMCIDRQALVAALGGEPLQPADMYLPADHPLYNAKALKPGFDPQKAGELLTAAGWADLDNDPATPRTALGAAGMSEGTPFVVEYLIPPDAERQAIGTQVQAWLGACGIQVNLVTQPFQEYLGAGPVGPVFGRHFDMAHLAWVFSGEPPCQIYMTSEIPGAYPAYAHGWGGANAAGYSSPAFDAACRDAVYSLSELPEHLSAHGLAQSIFAEELPALPLFWRYKVLAARADFCGIENGLENLESFGYGDICP